jgi:hypothetical protein
VCDRAAGVLRPAAPQSNVAILVTFASRAVLGALLSLTRIDPTIERRSLCRTLVERVVAEHAAVKG